jgi:hypothetical protein
MLIVRFSAPFALARSVYQVLDADQQQIAALVFAIRERADLEGLDFDTVRLPIRIRFRLA